MFNRVTYSCCRKGTHIAVAVFMYVPKRSGYCPFNKPERREQITTIHTFWEETRVYGIRRPIRRAGEGPRGPHDRTQPQGAT